MKMRAWIKFNAWSKTTPCTNESLQVYFNSGVGKQKNNSFCLTGGKMKDFSQGARRAYDAFLNQVEPDFKVALTELQEHNEPCKSYFDGTFCITDVGNVMGQNVGADGLWLVVKKDEVAFFYNLSDFKNVEI